MQTTAAASSTRRLPIAGVFARDTQRSALSKRAALNSVVDQICASEACNLMYRL